MSNSENTPDREGKQGEPLPSVGGAPRPDPRVRTAPPGFRRLEVGEVIQEHDVVWPAINDDLQETIAAGSTVEYGDLGYYYRRLPADAAPAAPEPASGEGSPLLEVKAYCEAIIEECDGDVTVMGEDDVASVAVARKILYIITRAERSA